MSYVILEWNQASHTPEIIDTDTYDERDDAVEHARTLLAANRSNGRREGYSVHELDDMPEWQDEDDRVPVESSGGSAVDAAPLYEVALGALRRHHPRPAQQPAVEQAARAIVAELEKQRVERGDDHIRLVGLGRTVEVRIVHNAVWLERRALAQGVTNKAVDDAIAVTAHAMLRESGSSSGGTT